MKPHKRLMAALAASEQQARENRLMPSPLWVQAASVSAAPILTRAERRAIFRESMAHISRATLNRAQRRAAMRLEMVRRAALAGSQCRADALRASLRLPQKVQDPASALAVGPEVTLRYEAWTGVGNVGNKAQFQGDVRQVRRDAPHPALL